MAFLGSVLLSIIEGYLTLKTLMRSFRRLLFYVESEVGLS
jgi:hypothetical protein